MRNYILDDNGNPVACDDLETWGKFMTYDNVRIADVTLANGVRVSTVFLGVDYSHGQGAPILWETMIFGGPYNQYTLRYRNLGEARKGHIEMVYLATGEIDLSTLEKRYNGQN